MAAVADHGSGYQITGLRETVRKLERLGIESQDLKRAFGRVSATVVRRAGADVPVITGVLKGTIRAANAKNKSVVRAGFSRRGAQAGAINYGWPARGIRPTHFLTDAANQHTTEYVRVIEYELLALIRSLNL